MLRLASSLFVVATALVSPGVFDGRKWTNVSPAPLPGGANEGGRRPELLQLADSRGRLVALTSTGELMTYRR